MKWYNRAKTRLKELKLTQTDLITPLGVKTRGTVGHYLSGRREPSQEQLIALTNKLKCSLDWLLTGHDNSFQIGTATSTDQAMPITVVMAGNTETAPAISGSVPLISWVQAGSWQEVIDNLHPGDAEEWIETTAKVSNQSFALRIKGDSMTNPYGSPSLPEGSIVIIDPNAQCDNGNIVVARLDDSMEATIKKLVIDGGQRYLKPLNPSYPTIQINGNCRVIGRAVRVELDL